VSRQRASELWREFSIYIGPYIQFRGQRFLNERQSGHCQRPRKSLCDRATIQSFY
jgi:hypothetical protein